MANKIPPSLNWLIKKHARTSGQIIRLKNKLSDVLPFINQLRELEKSLEAIQESLKLHDIQIAVENIKPIRPSRISQFKFKYGVAGKLVINYLKSKYGLGPIPKTEIDDFLIQEHLKLAPDVKLDTGEIGRWEINPELIFPVAR